MKISSLFFGWFVIGLIVGLFGVAYLWSVDYKKSVQLMAQKLKGVQENISQIRDDVASLKTDYAEVERLRDACKSVPEAREQIPAFKEFDDVCGQLFMGILAKEQELDGRLKKLEAKRCGK